MVAGLALDVVTFGLKPGGSGTRGWWVSELTTLHGSSLEKLGGSSSSSKSMLQIVRNFVKPLCPLLCSIEAKLCKVRDTSATLTPCSLAMAFLTCPSVMPTSLPAVYRSKNSSNQLWVRGVSGESSIPSRARVRWTLDLGVTPGERDDSLRLLGSSSTGFSASRFKVPLISRSSHISLSKPPSSSSRPSFSFLTFSASPSLASASFLSLDLERDRFLWASDSWVQHTLTPPAVTFPNRLQPW